MLQVNQYYNNILDGVYKATLQKHMHDIFYFINECLFFGININIFAQLKYSLRKFNLRKCPGMYSFAHTFV